MPLPRANLPCDDCGLNVQTSHSILHSPDAPQTHTASVTGLVWPLRHLWLACRASLPGHCFGCSPLDLGERTVPADFCERAFCATFAKAQILLSFSDSCAGPPDLSAENFWAPPPRCAVALFLAAPPHSGFEANFLSDQRTGHPIVLFASDLATSWAWLDENLRAITGFSGSAG